MKQNGKIKNILFPAILLGIFAAQILYVTHGGYVYGNDYDWSAQHVVFPDYMRRLFYSTGKLFPDFALNIGCGQNIYYIAYYGLFSPVVLFSYLLPFVPMEEYMVGASVFLCALSIVLIYRWLSKHFSGAALYISSLMYTLAYPVMYHSHHHLMFVNYLPFMILAMEGLEAYYRKNKRLLLIFSVLFIILSSYFFSVGAIAALCVYWLYLYIESPDRHFIKKAAAFLRTLLIPVMMSAVLWLPELAVMFSGRAKTASSFTLKELLTPSLQIDSFFDSPDGMGLSLLFLICVIGMVFSHKRQQRFAGIFFILLMLFPLPVYLLNGGMYVNGKVLIPFLPFAVLISGYFLESAFKKCHRPVPRMLLASAVAVTTVCSLFGCIIVNGSDKLLASDRDPRQVYGKDAATLVRLANDSSKELVRTDLAFSPYTTSNYICDISQLGTGIYSSLNAASYHNYFFFNSENEVPGRSNANIRTVKNPMNALRLGVRYLIGPKDRSYVSGYKKKAESGSLALYENSSVLPIGYISSSGSFRPGYTSLSPDSINRALTGISGVTPDGGAIHFSMKNAARRQIGIKPADHTRIVMITMHVTNQLKSRDLHITINGEKNTLPASGSRYSNGNNDFHFTLLVKPRV
ncbi:MAG: YfhO family protein, partial [Candidatus Weimeria sp.]